MMKIINDALALKFSPTCSDETIKLAIDAKNYTLDFS